MKSNYYYCKDFSKLNPDQVGQELSKYQSIELDKFSEPGLTNFCEAFALNTTVLHFYLYSQTTVYDMLKKFVSALKINKTLTKLEIVKCHLDSDGAEIIADLMNCNDTIVGYVLNRTDIGNEGALIIAGAVSKHRTLISLALTDNGIGEAGLIAIAEACGDCQSLSKVNIAYNNQTYVSQFAMLTNLYNHPSMTSINFGYREDNNLLVDIINFLKVNKKVEYINLGISTPFLSTHYKTLRKEIGTLLEDNKFYRPIAKALADVKDGEITQNIYQSVAKNLRENVSCNTLKAYQKMDKNILGEYLSANYGIASINAFCEVVNLYIASSWPEILGIFKSSELFSNEVTLNVGLALGDQSLHCLGEESLLNNVLKFFS